MGHNLRANVSCSPSDKRTVLPHIVVFVIRGGQWNPSFPRTFVSTRSGIDLREYECLADVTAQCLPFLGRLKTEATPKTMTETASAQVGTSSQNITVFAMRRFLVLNILSCFYYYVLYFPSQRVGFLLNGLLDKPSLQASSLTPARAFVYIASHRGFNVPTAGRLALKNANVQQCAA